MDSKVKSKVIAAVSLLVLLGLSIDINEESTPYGSHSSLRRALKITDRFLLRGDDLEEVSAQKPYLVRLDDETGEFIETIQHGDPDHPLSRLLDVRPPYLDDFDSAASRERKAATAFFFMLPETYGGKIKAIMEYCYNLRMDTQAESLIGQTTTERPTELVANQLVDVISTSYFYDGMMTFTPEHKGKAFTILEHPATRAENYYRSRDPSLQTLSLSEYVESPHYRNNWVVRSLTNTMTGELNEDHLSIAKSILARKFVVGVADHLKESFKRLEMYYHWPDKERLEDYQCMSNHVNEQGGVLREESTVGPGDAEWTLIENKDYYDLELYRHALELLVSQGTTMFGRPHVDKQGGVVDFKKLAQEAAEKRKKLSQPHILFIDDETGEETIVSLVNMTDSDVEAMAQLQGGVVEGEGQEIGVTEGMGHSVSAPLVATEGLGGEVEGQASLAAISGSAPLVATSGSAPLRATSGSAPLVATSGSASLAATSGSASLAATSGSASLAATSGSAPLRATSGSASLVSPQSLL